MNKSEVVAELASFTGGTQVSAKFAVESLMEVYTTSLLNREDVSLPGIGKLKIYERPARNGRNPKTGEAILIPAKTVVKFKPSSTFTADMIWAAPQVASQAEEVVVAASE